MRLLWWLQDHRGGIAVALTIAAAAAAVYLLVLPDGGGGGELEMEAKASQEAVEAAQSGRYGQGIGGERDIAVEKTPPRETMAAAARRPRHVAQEKQAPALLEPAPCAAGIARGSVVVVSTTGVSCAAARPLVAVYESGPVARSQVGEFACGYSEVGLQTTCTRARDASTVALLFGPGGPGLEDCQVVPVGDESATVRVRADGVACDDARTTVFRYFEAGRQGPRGYSCRESETVGIPTVRCTSKAAEIAFTAPVSGRGHGNRRD